MEWSEALDELDRQLAAHEWALDSGAAEFPQVALPGDMGPLPAELATRVEAVLGRTRHVAERVVAQQQAVLRAVTAKPPVRRPAAYLDTRA